MKDFDNALNITRLICEFIFSHSETVPPEIRALSFGISSSNVSVRFFGWGIYSDHFETEAAEMYLAIKNQTGENLSITSFMEGLSLRLAFDGKGVTKNAREDIVPEGALFHVGMADGKNNLLKDKQLFINALKPLFRRTFPILSPISIFLNGESVELV